MERQQDAGVSFLSLIHTKNLRKEQAGKDVCNKNR